MLVRMGSSKSNSAPGNFWSVTKPSSSMIKLVLDELLLTAAGAAASARASQSSRQGMTSGGFLAENHLSERARPSPDDILNRSLGPRAKLHRRSIHSHRAGSSTRILVAGDSFDKASNSMTAQARTIRRSRKQIRPDQPIQSVRLHQPVLSDWNDPDHCGPRHMLRPQACYIRLSEVSAASGRGDLSRGAEVAPIILRRQQAIAHECRLETLKSCLATLGPRVARQSG